MCYFINNSNSHSICTHQCFSSRLLSTMHSKISSTQNINCQIIMLRLRSSFLPTQNLFIFRSFSTTAITFSPSSKTNNNNHRQQSEIIVNEILSSPSSSSNLDSLTFSLLRLVRGKKKHQAQKEAALALKKSENKHLSSEKDEAKMNAQTTASGELQQPPPSENKVLKVVNEELINMIVRHISDFRTPPTSIRYLASIIDEITSPVENCPEVTQKAKELILSHRRLETVINIMLERHGNNRFCIIELAKSMSNLIALDSDNSSEVAKRFSTYTMIDTLNFAILKQTHVASADRMFLPSFHATAKECVEVLTQTVTMICRSHPEAISRFLKLNSFVPLFDAFMKFDSCGSVCSSLAILLGEKHNEKAAGLRKSLVDNNNREFVIRVSFLLHYRALTSSEVMNVASLIIAVNTNNPTAQEMFAKSHRFGRALVSCFPIAFMNDECLKTVISAITSVFVDSKDFSKTASVLVYFQGLIDLLLYSSKKSIESAQKKMKIDENNKCNLIITIKDTTCVSTLLHSMASLCALTDGLPLFEDDDELSTKNATDRKIVKSVKSSVREGVEFLSKNVTDFKEVDEFSNDAWKVMKESKLGRQILFKLVKELFA